MPEEDLLKRARAEIVAMQEYPSARQLVASHDAEARVFLDANECPFEPLLESRHWARYPDKQPAELVRALADMYGVPVQNLLVARGGDEVIDLCIRAFCRPYQDSILIHPPTFPIYVHAAALQGAGVVSVPLLPPDFALDADGLIAAKTDAIKVVFVCTPNNPTGNLLNRADVMRVVDAYRGHALVVIDEAYIDYTDEDSYLPVLESNPHVAVLRTLSKSHAAAGLRIGSLIAHPDIVRLFTKMLQMYPFSKPTIDAAMRVLAPAATARIATLRAEIVETKKHFIQAISTLPCVVHIFDSHTNFVLVRMTDAGAALQTLKAEGYVPRRPGSGSGIEDCLRFAIGTREQMDGVIAVLKKIG